MYWELSESLVLAGVLTSGRWSGNQRKQVDYQCREITVRLFYTCKHKSGRIT